MRFNGGTLPMTTSQLKKSRGNAVWTVISIFTLTLGLPLLAREVTPQPSQPPASNAETDTGVVEELIKKEKPTIEVDPDKKPGASADAVPEAKPAQKPAKKSLQETIQEGLIGAAQAHMQNPVESILDRMRSVQEKLTKTSTDKETRKEQTQIVEEIDKLIEALKNQKPPPPQQNSNPDSGSPPPSGPPPMGGNQDDKQQAQGTSQPRPRNSQKQQSDQAGEKGKAQGQKQSQAGQGESVSDKARDSNGSSAKRPRTVEEEAARQRMAKDIWGHLPPAKRAELLNIISEKYIPKYDEQVRRYYEALAEEMRGNK
jgi:hypothetical protein